MADPTVDEALQLMLNLIEQYECNGPTRRALEGGFRVVAQHAKLGEQMREAAAASEDAASVEGLGDVLVYPEGEPIGPIDAAASG